MRLVLFCLCDGRKPYSCRGLPSFKSGSFSRSLRISSFLRPAANFRIGTRSNGFFSRLFGGFLAMTLKDLTQMFSTDEQCRVLLKKLRWPYGVECIRCKSKRVFEVATQKKFECVECGYQFSALTQTVFHDTHLPL